jgi:hypothetical protein
MKKQKKWFNANTFSRKTANGLVHTRKVIPPDDNGLHGFPFGQHMVWKDVTPEQALGAILCCLVPYERMSNVSSFQLNYPHGVLDIEVAYLYPAGEDILEGWYLSKIGKINLRG